jgi:hypothetical protein
MTMPETSVAAYALQFISQNPALTLATLADAMGWKLYTGEPNKMRACRIIKKLAQTKLVKKTRTGHYKITDYGTKVLNNEIAEPATLLARQPRQPLAPPLNPGDVRIYKGQPYVLVGQRPCTTRFGRQITLDIWRSQCADCGAWFETARPSRAKRFKFNRRCQDHKAPGRRVSLIRKLTSGLAG